MSGLQRFAADAAGQLARAWRGVADYAARQGLTGWDRPGATTWTGASYADPALAGWQARLTEANRDLALNRREIVSRARELQHNEAWASVGLTRQVDQLAGAGFRLSARVNAAALGIAPEAAAELNAQIERLWNAYAESSFATVDLQRRSTFTQLSALGFLHRLRDGESVAVSAWRDTGEPWFATRFGLVDPDRLAVPSGRSNGQRLEDGGRHWSGIDCDPDGAPVRYWIRDSHPGDVNAWRDDYTAWPRWDRQGLPVTLHDFKPERAGQVRGASEFAPLIRVFRQLGRYSDAELDAAIINALIAATIETAESPAQIADRLTVQQQAQLEEGRLSHYEKNPAVLGGVRALLLKPGDKAVLNASPRAGRGFGEFEGSLIGKIGAQLGMTRDQLTGDLSRVNYSSGRLGLLGTRQWLRARRSDYVRNVTAPFYLVWLAEAFDAGYLETPEGAPSFEADPEAYSAHAWLTPGLGHVDPVKEAEGAQLRLAYGLSTLQQEAAELGHDWRELAAQTAAEVAHYQALGLTHPAARGPVAPTPTAPEQPSPQPAPAGG